MAILFVISIEELEFQDESKNPKILLFY